jgi:hypothetical protein
MYEQHAIDSSVMVTNGLMEDGTRSERHGQMLAVHRCANSDLIVMRSLNAGEPCSEMERHITLHSW